MTKRSALFLTCSAVALLVGCPSSHPAADSGRDASDGEDGGSSDGGDRLAIDGNRQLVELSDEEWAALCAWRAALPESPTYYCDEATYLGPDAGTCSGCTFYDWRVERCYDPLEDDTTGVIAFWRSQPTDCLATVSMLAACSRDEAEVQCYEAFLSTAACIALRCYPEPSDAGVPIDGP